MKISKDSRKLTKELFKLSFKDGVLDESAVAAIAGKVAADKPRHYIEILKAYQRLIRLEIEKLHAIVESATPQSEAEIERLLGDLRGKYGQGLTAEFKVNPELIGGLRVRLGSNVWDSSVRGNLNRLESQLAHV